MFSAQVLGEVVRERVRAWEDELYHESLVAQLPRRSPYWRRMMTVGVASFGVRLTQLGEWVVQRAYAASAQLLSEAME